jgi:multidrug efflux pump subunit AcrA (membrane-fusion protein)
MTIRTQGRLRWTASAAALLLTGGALAGCAGASSEATTREAPVTVETSEGSDLARITLTQDSATRLGLETGVVEQDGTGLSVPYSALLYLADGTTWVYTNPEALVYTRAPVTVARVDGDSVILTDGPAPGTVVVITAAVELFGSEFDTEE